MDTSPLENTEILIIGAGPAGLTSAIYSAWLGYKTVVLESNIPGGRAWLAPKIENFPGFPEGIKGSDLVERMRKQAERFNAEFRNDEEVIALELKGTEKKVVTRKQTYTTPALIIATGTQRRKLNIPQETEFLGRGLSYCAICDGPFFRHKQVAVIGNGDEAANEALSLADLASQVVIVTQEKSLDADAALLQKLKSKPNLETIKGKATQIIGNQVVKAIKITDFDTQKEIEHPVQGIFVALGSIPLTAIMQNAGIATDKNGCLIVNRNQQTNVDGIFAAGDCTCGGMQVTTAAGEGAMAAMRASAYVKRSST
ncbi:MAG: FAD-dependent oxidoreductase [Candidatus Bathyarchaeota archaeon]|nr:FAD-dependent oxidoreductase [Candidatus Bathyarchaeota archaeon]